MCKIVRIHLIMCSSVYMCVHESQCECEGERDIERECVCIYARLCTYVHMHAQTQIKQA